MLTLAHTERERESSLKTSSSSPLKKSFTLIELSIVLLILSLLVGSLLVGRQIVDRAKIQRIIFEFDYYEKAFHQFYDTYHYVPSSLPYKQCIKYSVFQGPACARTDTACQNNTGPWTYHFNVQQWCQQFTTDVAVPAKLVSSTWTQIPLFNHLVVTGLIEGDNGYRQHLSTGMTEKNSNFVYRLFREDGWRSDYYATTFDRNVYLRIYAFHKKNAASYLRGLPMTGENYFVNRLLDKNIMLFYGLVWQKHPSGPWIRSANTFTSALNSKLASELDAKIDDGRPTTGNLMGIVPAKGINEADAEKMKKYCYDAAGNDIEKALYNTSTNTQYGCDLIKVMEPVK